MFETSQDILYLTVAICLAVFTGFLCWLLYYIGQISRQSNEMITDFRERLEQFDESVQELKTKVTASVDSIASISQQVGSIIELVRSLAGKKRSKR
ncbi:MAG: hypothetical protein HYV33_00500 [Candidatus Kerfeldbacteria bacterium]|nr:hypothetical protein [Candidatus Kerfeldbacteria bacterium]